MLKLKAYDKYHQQWVYIEPVDDTLAPFSSSRDGVKYELLLRFSAVEGDKDNCSPERWSDLEQFEVVS